MIGHLPLVLSSQVETMPNSLFLSSLLLLALSFQTSRTALVSGCRSNSDCPVASCCVLGMTRFGTPWCQSLRQLGDECRPRSELSVSRNLTYPNGFVLQLNDVHEVRRRLSDCSAQKRVLQYLISFFFLKNSDYVSMRRVPHLRRASRPLHSSRAPCTKWRQSTG